MTPDGPEEAAQPNLDLLVRIAASACGSGGAFIALVEGDELRIKAQVGLSGSPEIPPPADCCRLALRSGAQGLLGVVRSGDQELTAPQWDILNRLGRLAVWHLDFERSSAPARGGDAALVQDLSRREAEQRFLIDHLMAGVVVHGPDGAVIRCNPRACELLRLNQEQMLGKQLIDPAWRFLRDDGTPMAVAEYPVSRVWSTGQGLQGLTLGVSDPSSAEITWLIGNAEPQLDEQGRIAQVVVTFVDITPLKALEVRLQRSERVYRALFENAMDGIILGRPHGEILDANPAACAIFGMSQEELRHTGRRAIVVEENPTFADFYARRQLSGRARAEIEMQRSSGERFTAEVASSNFEEAPGQWLTSVIVRDVTDRKRSESQIRRLAYFDDLTALPNRRFLTDKLSHAMAAAARLGHFGALFFVDLDNFKHINDARGHLVGDRLLRRVSQRLLESLRAEDTLARIGGDEFIVLLENVGPDLDAAGRGAMHVAETVRQALEMSYEIEGESYSSRGSIGVTLYPRDAQTVDDVIREADTAMYRAKAAGRNHVVFYESSMQQQIEQRLALEQDLTTAVRNRELVAHAQPQFNADGCLVGAEILLRWPHPLRGQVSPGEFIPIAEQGGLIHEIGDWVLTQACQGLVEMAAGQPDLRLSVNVSPQQFLHAQFVNRVRKILGETGAAASRLVFEVTETLLIRDWEVVGTRFQELAAMGIRFSIDDFGTGYSSLAYLKRIPLYELKIDRSFVAAVPDDANDVAIVESILSIARNLKLKVVAEGVETAAQARFLIDAKCDFFQGYYYARPLPLQQWIRSLPGPRGND